jgi:hypothetical protein
MGHLRSMVSLQRTATYASARQFLTRLASEAFLNPDSAVEETSRHEREAILEQRRHGTVQITGFFLFTTPSLLI